MNRLAVLLFTTVLLFTLKARTQTTVDCNAEFTVTVAGLTGSFYAGANTDSSSVKHFWEFGDGTTADGKYVVHNYHAPGTYVVTQTVKRISPNGAVLCEKTFSKNITIQPAPIPCDFDAGFSFKRDNVQSNKVYFYNTTPPSSVPTIVKWSFGDGTYSDADSPVHVFTASGLYTVCLYEKRGDNCYDDTCNYLQVQVTASCDLTANFTSEVDPVLFTTIHFQNLSTPLSSTDSVKWSFGDGSYSEDISPTHNYNVTGTYTVCLRVKKNSNATGTVPCVREYCQVIVVKEPCDLKADFTFVKDSLSASPIANLYRFTNTSVPAAEIDSVFWNFGDGSPVIINVNNPVHAFAAPGNYHVCLIIKKKATISGVLCASYLCKNLVVEPPSPCSITVYFAWRTDSADHKMIHFTNYTQPINTAAHVTWTFGDGSSGDGWNADHTYEKGGTYHVCLVVKQNDTCIREFCKEIKVDSVPLPPPCNLAVYFYWKADSVDHRKIHFTNYTQPVNTAAHVTWSFGDGSSADGWNADHTYEKGGTYHVCLVVKQNDTCSREFCRDILVDSITLPSPCDLAANFYFKHDSIQTNKIYFSSSVPLQPNDAIKWSFGDGLGSDDHNPIHTYTSAGAFNVCLYIYRGNGCYSDTCKMVEVHVADPLPCNLVANFTAEADPAYQRQIHFKNLSAPFTSVDSIKWSFGDGSYSKDINPVHVYNAPGTYNVCIRVQIFNAPGTAPCVKEYCHAVTVKDSCGLKADFVYYKDSTAGIALNTYHFKNTSEPTGTADSTSWNFGDGSPIVINSNDPVHVYPVPGTYIVCLVVKRGSTASNGVSCVQEICKTIVVPNPPPTCTLQANFDWKVDPLDPKKILFLNLSQPLTTSALIEWSFGDGTGAASWNADHTYSYSGEFTVCLKIRQSNTCYGAMCKVIKIDSVRQDSCNLQVSFTNHAGANNDRNIVFTNTTIANSSAGEAAWSFGDGTSANTWNAEHLYTAPGTYTVCLKIRTGAECTRYTCHTIIVEGNAPDCDGFYARFETRKDSYLPNKIYFTAVTNVPQANQTWVITKLFSLDSAIIVNQNNPVWVFEDTGHYDVCLVIPAGNDCIKIDCNPLFIYSTAVPEQCILQPYPNPARDIVNVNLELASATTIKISVFDMQNVLLIEKAQAGVMGNNIVQVNVGALPQGYYYMRFLYGDKVCYARFQKL